MDILDTLYGSFITLICEPVKENEITNKIEIIGASGRIVLCNTKTDSNRPYFFISYSKPCFSLKQTLFINIIHGEDIHIGTIKEARFLK